MEPKIDKAAFRSLTCGLYIVTAKAGERAAGCVVNTLQQVTSSPAQVSVALHKENATTAAIQSSGRFAASCLAQDAAMELIGTFGFHCSDDIDKFAAFKTAIDGAGVPYVAGQSIARFSSRVVQEVDLGTHVMFVGEVEEAEKLSDEAPMTYAYYHQAKGGTTPPKASSYQPDELPVPAASASAESAAPGTEAAEKPRYAWRCTICGHIEYADELPDDFSCPLCMVGPELFERIEL